MRALYVKTAFMPLLLFLLLVFLCAPPACAQTTDDAREQLSHTLAALKASKERERQIEEKTARLERELKSLQQELVDLAKNTGTRETELSSYEDKLAILEEQKKQKSEALAARQAELSAMISAMVKLREVPPEAVIAMPGKLDETLATARALGLVTHAIESEANGLRAQLRELDTLENKIRQGRETVHTHKSTLDEKRRELEEKVKERSRLQAELGGKEREERERAARLNAKSQSLQELLDSLQKSERTNVWEREMPGAVKKHEKAAGKHKMRSFEEADGNIRMPASGRVISRYGNTGLGQAFSKGMVIDTREDAQVVAPYDGEVVFAGNFRDYGRMVIIRHTGNYHTLLSGLSNIDATPGQFLLEGEPVGSMGSRPSGTHLYVELREDGKPTNPLQWFKE